MPVVIFAAVVLASTSLLAYLGRYFWVLDNLASFRPQLTAGLALASLLVLVGRWPRTAALIGAVTVANALTLLPLFLPIQSAPGSSDVRILSFNVLSDNQNLDRIMEYIREVDADLVVLHEASLPWEEAVAKAGFDYEITITRHSEDIFGSLVLAPPGSEVESFGFRVRDPRAVTIAMADGLTVLAVHPVSPLTAERSRLRNQQLALAGNWVNEQSSPVVVVGDFNASPFSYPYRRLLADTGLRDSIHGYGLQNSYPSSASPVFRVSIDHLLYSEGVEVADRILGPALGSDHFPLIVDLSLPTPSI